MIELKLKFEQGEEIVLARTIEFLDKLRNERAQGVTSHDAPPAQTTDDREGRKESGDREVADKPKRQRPSRSKAAIAEREAEAAAKAAEQEAREAEQEAREAEQEAHDANDPGDDDPITVAEIKEMIEKVQDAGVAVAEVLNFYKQNGIRNTSSLEGDSEKLSLVYNYLCDLIDGVK